MVKIRLTRLGKHKLPFYRIVAIDARSRRDGSYIELLGTYEPISGKVDVKKDLVLKWLNLGAQPSDTVLNILKNNQIWSQYKQSKIKSKKST